MNEVKYYRKKPVVIQAYQTDKVMYIETLEGTHKANVGDFIITGVHGEQYPCKPDIFQKTYEQVTEKDYLALKDRPIYADIICYSKKEYEEYDSAIEKQIAKKPKGETDPMFGDITTVCPNCGNANLVNPFVISKVYDYCPNCGQKLDWSNIDE